MISYVAYKNIHLFGIFMMLIAYGSLLTRESGQTRIDRLAAVTHGLGTLLSLVAGFGMIARLSIHWPFPGWVIGKILIWIFLAVGISIAKRRLVFATVLWWSVLIACGLAAWLALNKPF